MNYYRVASRRVQPTPPSSSSFAPLIPRRYVSSSSGSGRRTKKRKIKLPSQKTSIESQNPYIAPPQSQPGGFMGSTGTGAESKPFLLAYVHHSALGSVDYTHPPPIRKSPPPPPVRPRSKSRYVLPITLLVTFGTIVYVYFNNQNDNYEYWDTMQTGGVLEEDEDDDEEFDDDDDFDSENKD